MTRRKYDLIPKWLVDERRRLRDKRRVEREGDGPRVSVKTATSRLREAGYDVEHDETHVRARWRGGYPDRLVKRDGAVSARRVRMLVTRRSEENE